MKRFKYLKKGRSVSILILKKDIEVENFKKMTRC